MEVSAIFTHSSMHFSNTLSLKENKLLLYLGHEREKGERGGGGAPGEVNPGSSKLIDIIKLVLQLHITCSSWTNLSQPITSWH
jgi:hypothetical protein